MESLNKIRFIPRNKFKTVHNKIKTKTLSTAEHRKYFKAAYRSQNLPSYFNWVDYNNVIRERFNNIPVPNVSSFI